MLSESRAISAAEAAPPPYSGAQSRRLATFGVGEIVDIHCHCLAGVDDGPREAADAMRLWHALVEDGVTTVLATPHTLGKYEGQNAAAAIRKVIAVANGQAAEAGLRLRILPGAEVRLDERIGQLLDGGELLTLADRGRHLLLELSSVTPLDIGWLIEELAARNVVPVIAHPERYPWLMAAPESLTRWLRRGASLQVTAGSVLGKAGRAAYDAAWALMRVGAVDLIASDAHDLRLRSPAMTAAVATIAHWLGPAEARRMGIDNPLAILQGRDLQAIDTRSLAANQSVRTPQQNWGGGK